MIQMSNFVLILAEFPALPHCTGLRIGKVLLNHSRAMVIHEIDPSVSGAACAVCAGFSDDFGRENGSRFETACTGRLEPRFPDSYLRFGMLSELPLAISNSFDSRSVYIAFWRVMIAFL